MCGIVGVAGGIDAAEGAALVARMNATLTHRGPDDEGAWAGSAPAGAAGTGVAFAMRRLSIIDLAGGHQPMWSGARAGEGVGIVFNGEIYNYRALRDALARAGRPFRTRSDTEVVLRLYESEGIAGLDRLDGMFAICLYDAPRGEVHLVRDRLGIKPLYYMLAGDRLYFASEIKAILAGLPAPPALDRQALHHYLTLRYVPAPETPWQGVRKLEPGHRLAFSLRKRVCEITRYWSVAFASQPLEPGRDYVAEFETLFLDAVEKRLVAADVPVGVMLSGGIDSSAIAAAAVELGHRNFHTFSVAFADGGRYSELEHAQTMAAHVGSHHHEVIIDRDAFVAALPMLATQADEPLADLASVPLHALSRLAREHVKVVLSGEGSDEILAGYNLDETARSLDRLRAVARIPRPLLRALAALAPGARGAVLRRLARAGWSGYLRDGPVHITRHWGETEKRALWREPPLGVCDTIARIAAWYDASPSPHPLDQLQSAYVGSWLVDDLLAKADRMSMAASLELRVPFLDHALVEWAARLPIVWKVGDANLGYSSKRILRVFADKRLPRSIVTRPKQGFPVPAYEWLAGPFGVWAADRLSGSDDNPLVELFDLAPAHAALDAARRGDAAAAHKVWVLIVLRYWLERWW